MVRMKQKPEVEEDRFQLAIGLRMGRRVWPHEPTQDEPRVRPLQILVLDPTTRKLEGRVAIANVPYESIPKPSHQAGSKKQNDREEKATIAINGTLFKVRSKVPCNVDLNDSKVAMMCGSPVNRESADFRVQMVYAVCQMVYRTFQLALGRDPQWAVRKKTKEAKDKADELKDRKPENKKAKANESEEIDFEKFDKPWCLEITVDEPKDDANACYDSDLVALNFGHFESPHSGTLVLRNQKIFTCLSHDIITHEVTHALLDGMRSLLMLPTNPQVAGFHEGFADIIAVFQRFEFSDLVQTCAEQSGWALLDHPLLTRIGQEFGHGIGAGDSIRSAVETDRQEIAQNGVFAAGEWLRNVERESSGEFLTFSESSECHEMGEVLLRAVYDGFRVSFKRRVARLAAIAGGGQAETSRWMSAELRQELVDEAVKTARQFRGMLIRAIDYLAPVNVTFSDYLRAVVTADAEMVENDRYDYRGAFIESFLRRGIMPTDVSGLSSDELKWSQVKGDSEAPAIPASDDGTSKPLIKGLSWETEGRMKPVGRDSKKKDGSYNIEDDEKYTWNRHEARAVAQGHLVIESLKDYLFVEGSNREARWYNLGLLDRNCPPRRVDGLLIRVIHPIIVESIRRSRRAGHAGKLVMDTVIEISQKVEGVIDDQRMEMVGGCTLILNDMGYLRYAIRQSLSKPESWRRSLSYSRSEGSRFWERDSRGALIPCQNLVNRIHPSIKFAAE